MSHNSRMTMTDYTLESTDGTPLQAVWSEPNGPAKATVVHVHGLGEHAGRHAHVIQALNDAGYAVAQFDLRGHGRSPGGRGHTPFDVTMVDVQRALDDAQARIPGVPRFLIGHSLGGLIVLNFVLRRRPELDGVVISSAGLRSPVLEQKLKMTAARVLASVLPTVQLPTGLDDNGLSRDQAVIDAYRADPLVHGKASFALGRDSSAAAQWALDHASEFDVPLLMIAGSEDPITYPRGTEEFAQQVRGEVTVHMYEGLRHEMHNEPEQAEVIADVVTWLDEHLG